MTSSKNNIDSILCIKKNCPSAFTTRSQRRRSQQQRQATGLGHGQFTQFQSLSWYQVSDRTLKGERNVEFMMFSGSKILLELET